MGAEQILVGEFEARCFHLAGNHQFRLPEEVLIVAAASRAIREHQRRLPASACPAGPLCVVGRRGRHVAHVDHVELADVDTQLHRGRAVHHVQIAASEPFFAVESQLVRHLRGVFPSFNAEQVFTNALVEVDEETVGLDAVVGQVRHEDVVVVWARTVGRLPPHR